MRETASLQQSGVTVIRVGIGDPTSRWGSCSSSGRDPLQLAADPRADWVRRATVAHEVAHRVHMNHGPHFHALVEKLFGSDPEAGRRGYVAKGPRSTGSARLV
jgi:predicted metal-dependent hydrolase